MSLRNFYMMVLGVATFVPMQTQAMLCEDTKRPSCTIKQATNKAPALEEIALEKPQVLENALEKNNQNCKDILQKIDGAKKILQGYDEQSDNVPLSEKDRYTNYVEDLNKLYERAKRDQDVNVRQDLYFISNKYF